VGSEAYLEVIPLVSRGCRISNEPTPARPLGTLWEGDLDGDGAPERFFTGGCSPERYFVVLKRQAARWTVWHRGEGLLVSAGPAPEGLFFVSLTEAYGIRRERILEFEQVEATGRVAASTRFSAVGRQPSSAAPRPGEACVVSRTSRLRASPQVDNAPEESGMGFEYPGNLLQVLAKGSSGRLLGRRGGWRWCAFARPAATEDANELVKSMLTPALLTLTPEPESFLTGWLPEERARR
jgi:hypothetical protein